MIKKIMLITLSIIIILTGCAEEVSTNNDLISQEKDNEEGKGEYIIEEDAVELFRELYNIVNLDNHQVYIIDDTLYVKFWFKNNALRDEIMMSKDYVMNYLVLKYSGKGAPIPYVKAVVHDYDKLKYSVFIDDLKVLEQSFSNLGRGNGGVQINYYENLLPELPSRVVKDEELNKFAKKLRLRYWRIENIQFQQTFKGNVLSIKIAGSKKYKERDILRVQKYIEEDLAPKVDYAGLVLQMYSKSGMYYEVGYHNKNGQGYWFNKYWGNHSFFDNNI